MKLDASCLRYLSRDDLRVLTAVEMGMKNHDVVPEELIVSIAKLRHGGAHKFLSTLHRFKLIYHDGSTYNGYRLTYHGYDILALRTLLSRGHITAVGSQIGVGKESDIYLAQTDSGEEVVLKFHRLGRTSFRAVKNKRDYLLHRKSASWLYMSRLAALREFAFMKALHGNGFPTPTPIDHNRHVVLMSRVDGFPMFQVRQGNMDEPQRVFAFCRELLVRLAHVGLIHCDFNEFNLMVNNTGNVTLIDFPQMVSTSHANAEEYFDRDVKCLVKFFAMKMRYVPDEQDIPDFQEVMAEAAAKGLLGGGEGGKGGKGKGLDELVKASGYQATKQQEEALLRRCEEARNSRDQEGEEQDDDDDDSSNEEEEDADWGEGGGLGDEEEADEEETPQGGGRRSSAAITTATAGGGAAPPPPPASSPEEEEEAPLEEEEAVA